MDYINIIGTLFDNSIEHVAALANQIKDLRLGKNLQDINEDIYDKIDTYINELYYLINTEKSRAELIEDYLSNQLSSLQLAAKDSIKHIFLTQALYDSLNTHDKDTLYFIVESTSEGSHFGDAFPLTFGQDNSKFGDSFPITLS